MSSVERRRRVEARILALARADAGRVRPPGGQMESRPWVNTCTTSPELLPPWVAITAAQLTPALEWLGATKDFAVENRVPTIGVRRPAAPPFGNLA
jgi:hypothetical protein